MPRPLSVRTMVSIALRVTLGIDAAQHVVGAKFQDHRIGARRHRPVEPRKPAGRGVAGHAGIGDVDGKAFGLERLFQPRRKGGRSGQPEACAQRIAECHDLDRAIGGQSRAGRGHKQDPCDRDNAYEALDQAVAVPI